MQKYSRNAKILKQNTNVKMQKYSGNAKILKQKRNAKGRKLPGKLLIHDQNTQEMLIGDKKFDMMEDLGWLDLDCSLTEQSLSWQNTHVFVFVIAQAVFIFAIDTCQ